MIIFSSILKIGQLEGKKLNCYHHFHENKDTIIFPKKKKREITAAVEGLRYIVVRCIRNFRCDNLYVAHKSAEI